jgi:3-deoxy-D-manno-octulosonic-acid transferase
MLSLIGLLLGLPLVLAGALSRKKRRETVKRRLMNHGLEEIGSKRPVWIHAVSVGEVIASVPLVKAIRGARNSQPIVVSVGTLTGYDVASQLLGEMTESVFFCPFDVLWFVRRTTRRVHPSLFLLVESDIWPNLVFEMKRLEVPFILVSGRLSPKSSRRYRRLSFFMRRVFSNMSSICAQTEVDAQRFTAIGADPDRVIVTGNIKFDQPLDSPSEEVIKGLEASLGITSNASVLLAGSTHHGEDEILLQALLKLKKSFPDLVLVLAPRHPARAKSVKEMFQKAGLAASLRTELAEGSQTPMPEAVIVDTMGELRRLYAVADVVFVGKSLVNQGGQNPLEPAALGKAILFGPHMFNFDLIARTLLEKGGAKEVADGRALAEEVRKLLADPERREAMGRRAFDTFMANRGAVERTLSIVERFRMG